MALNVCGKSFQVVSSLNNVSDKAGVYLFLKFNSSTSKYRIIYVGRTERSMRVRIFEHPQAMLKQATHFGYCEISTEKERKNLEVEIFREYNPLLNDKEPS